jgi:peptidoglycan/LPS O-acetylase OafA/YrhL
MQSSSGLYLSKIDHLRFAAALLVMWWHMFTQFPEVIPLSAAPAFPPLSLLDEGHTGVSLFFVLSGFILTVVSGGKHVDYASFVRNRILRIAPLAIFWMLLLFYIIPGIDPVAFVVGVLTTIARTEKTIPLVGWSIIVEFQFYLLFPFLIAFLARYGASYLVRLSLLFIALRAIVYVHQGSTHFVSYFTIYGRFDQFLMGMVAASLYLSHAETARRNALALLLGGLAVTIAAVHLLNLQGGLLADKTYGSKDPYFIVFNAVEALGYAAFILG